MFYTNLITQCEKNAIKPTPLMKILGLSPGNLQRWESGVLPNGETLLKLADYFNVSIDYLLGRTNTPTTELTEKEEKLLGAYHNHPELQAAIDRMLEIDSSESTPFDKPKEAPFKGRLIAYGGTNIGEPDDDDEPRIT